MADCKSSPVKPVCIKAGCGVVGKGSSTPNALAWSKQPGNLWVGRNSFYLKLAGYKYANPFKPDDYDLDSCLLLYIYHLQHCTGYHTASTQCSGTIPSDGTSLMDQARRELKGTGANLGCMCLQDKPNTCHAQLLAEFVNS